MDKPLGEVMDNGCDGIRRFIPHHPWVHPRLQHSCRFPILINSWFIRAFRSDNILQQLIGWYEFLANG